MKKVVFFALALLVAAAFVSTGFAQEKPAEKPAAAPEKAVAAPEKAAAPEAKAEAAEKPAKPKPKKIPGFVGKVESVDAAGKLVTVKGAKDTVTFDVAAAKFKGYKSVDEIKAGDKIAVKYAKDASMKVTKIGAAKKAAKAPKKAKAEKAEKKDKE